MIIGSTVIANSSVILGRAITLLRVGHLSLPINLVPTRLVAEDVLLRRALHIAHLRSSLLP